MTDLRTVVDRVDERVAPDATERERLERAAAALEERVRSALAELPVDADVLRVGSTARDTWLSGDRDIDLFVRFPASLDRAELEAYGLRVGRSVLPDGREEYAEHPYVTGTYDGFDVDLVPCYDVADATAIRSAVDRTPFHTAYLDDRLDPALAGDVRALKRLLKSVGAYGSDLRTRGFSGYLTELLVLAEGGAVGLFEAAADWSFPVRYDPGDHGTAEFDGPLVVIDPTDPERNVAAVCAPEHVARLQHHARDLLAEPRIEPFFRPDPEPLDPDAVREHVRRRGTTPLAVVFDAPDVVEDQLYPQLRRSLSGIVDELDRRGFDPVRSRAFAADRAALLVEVAVPELPAVARHEGPPTDVREHAAGFYESYADDPDVYGPFLDGTRYVVERPREVRTARGLLAGETLFDVALGARVEDALRAGYEVLSGPDVAALAETEAFGRALAEHFEPTV
ncbi:MAG: CCA tRNA nucleotidyltransferase [Haloferacaceae archaeon]